LFSPESTADEVEQFLNKELLPSDLLPRPENVNDLLDGILDSFEVQESRLYDRAIPVGEVAVIHGAHLRSRALQRRLRQLGYHVFETPHFLYCRGTKAFPVPSLKPILLVHWFTPDDLHTNIPHYLVEELKPFGGIPDNRRLGEWMTGIVSSTLPGNVQRAWNAFGANTLQRLLLLVCTAAPEIAPDYGILEASATLYQRVLELSVGARFLDAGCNSGFFALLVAERQPFVEEIIGVDLDPQVFQVAQQMVRTRQLSPVRYVQADLRSDQMATLGLFDTVTALHILEHFTEEDMYRVLAHLLQITKHRLIIAVPYEERLSHAYDHLQLFSRTKLEAVGTWCLDHLEGAGRLWYEDLAGGLLLIEKRP
ncbi:MAG: class I SAM-dependent methyltransferase, partial [Ktedonobacteraceae bacterium]|nr:class I SAM-dependent methyltransferase [Ktedonobacteraceae bacterium]